MTAAKVVCRKLADDTPNRFRPADVSELIDDPDWADPVKFNSVAIAAPLVGRTAPPPVSARVEAANVFAGSLADPWPANAMVPAAFVLRAVRFAALAEPVRLKTAAVVALLELRVAPCPTKAKFTTALDDPATLFDPDPLKPREAEPDVLTDARVTAEPIKFSAAEVAAFAELRTVPCPLKASVADEADVPAELDDPDPLKPREAEPDVLTDARVTAEPIKFSAAEVAAFAELRTVPCPLKASVADEADVPAELDDPDPLNVSVPAALALTGMTLAAAPDPAMVKKPPPCARAEGAVAPLPVNDKSPPADALTWELAAPPPVKDSVAAVSMSPGVEAPADPVKLIDGVAAMTAKDIPKYRLDVSEPAKVANSGRTSEETRPRAKPPRAAAPIERQRSAMMLSAYDRRRKTRKT